MNRRRFLTQIGTGVLALGATLPALASNGTPRLMSSAAWSGIDATAYGLRPNASEDQSTDFQRAVDGAAARGVPLLLPGGDYRITGINLPDRCVLAGIAGLTRLVQSGPGPIFSAQHLSGAVLQGLTFLGAGPDGVGGSEGLIDLRHVGDLRIDQLTVTNAGKDGLYLEACGGRVRDCAIEAAGRFAIYAVESIGLTIEANDIIGSADGGIIIHRWSAGYDGTIVAGNRISRTGAASGGTGQWGNAVNVYLADDVTVTGNKIGESAFSAIRGNTTRNLHILHNNCRTSGETAIYSEFGFENTVVHGNIVNGGANGISVTNFNEGGHGATVSSNVIRNISATGPYRADPPGFGTGIWVEADTVVSGNVLNSIMLYGINAGWGSHLRDCLISSNVIRDAHIGVGFSVAPGAGNVLISQNVIGAYEGAIRAHRWDELVGGELLGAAQAVPANALISDNRLA